MKLLIYKKNLIYKFFFIVYDIIIYEDDIMNSKLFFDAIIKILLGIILVCLLIFVPAGTINYFNGWLLCLLLFVPMFIVGIIMMIKSPNLLKKRLNAKEKIGEQKLVILLSLLMFVGGFIISGLDYRYGWSNLNDIVVIISCIVFLISYIGYAEVLRENAYLSRTIEVQENQKVVDTGLYGIVRHPMYLVTIFLFLSMPLILGSLYGFLIFLIYPFIIVKRLLNEEKILMKELDGYSDYMKKVKYRLIPFIW